MVLVIEKYLDANINEIKKALEKNKDFDIQKILQRTMNVKINRLIV